ncbi:MAG: SWIM zinc finger family protein [Nitrospirota bacterium]|nr:SWIM zinc finger family protein [Nitrospirota bacterium]
MKKYVSKVQVVGSTGKVYTIAKDEKGNYSCSCPAWIFQRGERKACKHIKSLNQMMAA